MKAWKNPKARAIFRNLWYRFVGRRIPQLRATAKASRDNASEISSSSSISFRPFIKVAGTAPDARHLRQCLVEGAV